MSTENVLQLRETHLLNGGKRRVFGILDFLSPVVAPDQHGSASAGWPARTQHVKVAVFGRSGVGKTSTVARLCGGDLPEAHHPTLGFHIASVYWPVMPSDPSRLPLLLHLDLWDAGAGALAKYDYIKPAMLKDAAVALFCFSVTDRSSWEGLGDLVEGTLHGTSPQPVRVVVGTKVDSPTREVTKAEMRELESSYGVPVLTTANVKHAETSRYLPRGVAPDLLHEEKPFKDELTAVLSRTGILNSTLL